MFRVQKGTSWPLHRWSNVTNEIAVLRIVPLAETLQLSNKMGKFLYFPFKMGKFLYFPFIY